MISVNPTNFDTDYYLLHNKDVSDALQKGLIKSAYGHFAQYGLREKRKWRLKAKIVGLDCESIINKWQNNRFGKGNF